MRFRPCIDLHDGKVKQIVGSSFSDEPGVSPVTNFETERPPADFAAMYQRDDLRGGHVIMLGNGNHQAALSALAAFAGGMHIGGGITPENAVAYLDAGASHVIVTSYVFRDGLVNGPNLRTITRVVGRKRLVLDLSCKQVEGEYLVATDRWQKLTDVALSKETLADLSQYCDEFLVHGAHVEGKQRGIDEDLVELLGRYSPIPVTYAGGARSIEDLERIRLLGRGKVDATIGSALDIFGGALPYADVVAWHRRASAHVE